MEYMNPSKEDWKRGILVSSNLRFSPATQELKEGAVDRVIEQAILSLGDPQGAAPAKIEEQGIACFRRAGHFLSGFDVQRSLERLSQAGRVRPLQSETGKRYVLSSLLPGLSSRRLSNKQKKGSLVS